MAAQTRNRQTGWASLLSHLNASKRSYAPLAAFLTAHEPDLADKSAKRLAERVRRGTPVNAAELDGVEAHLQPVLVDLLNALGTEYREATGSQSGERATVAKLKKRIPIEEQYRLAMLRELANGKALTGADLVQAQLRTEAAVRSWLAMDFDEREAWFARVEADLVARDKKRSPEDPPLISQQYRRLYLRPKRRIVPSDDYRTLGLHPGASADEIKRAYRQLALRHHPDRNGDPAAFVTLHQAYQRLMAGTS